MIGDVATTGDVGLSLKMAEGISEKELAKHRRNRGSDRDGHE
jgi:hypothetical protein